MGPVRGACRTERGVPPRPLTRLGYTLLRRFRPKTKHNLRSKGEHESDGATTVRADEDMQGAVITAR